MNGVTVALLLQLPQQGLITEVLLEIDRAGVIHKIDLRHRTAMFPKMPAEINKRLVLADIIIVCRDIGPVIRPDTEIDAVAAGLGNDIQLPGRAVAIRLPKFSDLFDDGLHKGPAKLRRTG